jgi:hypothetical protein
MNADIQKKTEDRNPRLERNPNTEARRALRQPGRAEENSPAIDPWDSAPPNRVSPRRTKGVLRATQHRLFRPSGTWGNVECVYPAMNRWAIFGCPCGTRESDAAMGEEIEYRGTHIVRQNYQTDPCARTDGSKFRVQGSKFSESAKRSHRSARGSKFQVQGFKVQKLRNEPIPLFVLLVSFCSTPGFTKRTQLSESQISESQISDRLGERSPLQQNETMRSPANFTVFASLREIIRNYSNYVNCNRITKRTHALGAPVQSSGFKVQSSRNLRNEAIARRAVQSSQVQRIQSFGNYQTNPTPLGSQISASQISDWEIRKHDRPSNYYETNPTVVKKSQLTVQARIPLLSVFNPCSIRG